jgi:zinc protease
MKRRAVLLSLIMVLASLLVFSAQAKPRPFETVKVPPLNPIKTPNVEKTLLANGIRVFFFEDHELPLIKINAMVRGGEVNESKIGEGELFGEVLRSGGTKSMSGDKVDEFLEKIGAEIESSSGDAFTTVRAKMLKENKDEVIPLFAEFLMSPAFAEDKIKLAKTQMYSEISRRNDEVMGLSRREFVKLIYGKDSPYARQTEYENIDALNREDLVRFHKKMFRPDETYIAVLGDFDSKEMKTALEKLLGNWKNDTPKPSYLIPQIPQPKSSVNFIEKNDVEQSTILLGHLGLRLDDPDYASVNMLSEILGGSMASRIFTQVRTLKGLAYGAGGYMIPAYDHNGAFYFYTSTKPESTKDALDTILVEIKKIREEKVTDEELKRSKDSYLNGYAFEFDSIEKIARRMVLYQFYGYPEKFNEELRSKIEKVSVDDVFNAAKNHLFDDKLAILFVGKKEVKDSLSSYGNINVIDITIPEPPEKEIIPEPTPESMKEGTALLTGAAQKMGAKQLSALQNYSFEGTMAIKSPMGEFSMNQKGVIVFPDKVYLDIQTPMGKMEQVIKGDEGYMAMGDKKRPLPESQLKEAKKSLYTSLCGVNLLKDVLAKKLEGQYIGEKELNSNKTKLVIVRIDAQPVKIYISGEGLICAISSRQNTQEGPKELLELFSDFRDVKGLKVPFASKTMDKDEVVESSANSKIDINIDIPENVEAILGIK